jgi:outer membrane protein
VARPAPAAFAVLAALAAARATSAQSPPAPPPAVEPVAQVTFDEAVRRALERNPTVGQATQAILRAEGLLAQARTVFHPTVDGRIATTVLDDARGFDGNITQPRTQSAFGAVVSYPLLAASRWAAKNQAADQVAIARISAEDVRRQVALAAAESYLAVIASQRQLEIALRSRETARALADYARTRLEAGQGSRLNFIRASQELAVSEGRVEFAELSRRQAQEALGVAIFAEGPVDAKGDPELAPASPPAGDAWLAQRPDVRLFSAQAQAADRVVRDTWKSWLPTATASFAPLYVTPAGFFEPGRTWRALFEVQIPIYDGTLGAERRIRIAERETARLRLDAVKVQAFSELRTAEESVRRIERLVAASREAAEHANEALRITEIAYRAGATTNVEVVQAQQTARNTEIVAAQAEDQLRQARLDLLVALGQFPQ